MKKQIGIITVALVMFAGTHCSYDRLYFVDANLDDFIKRIIPNKKDQIGFEKFYDHMTKKLSRESVRRYFYALALRKLKNKHFDWYQELHPYTTDPIITLETRFNHVRNLVRLFLIRYGVCEEYYARKKALPEKNRPALVKPEDAPEGFWMLVKVYAQSIGKRVTHLFDGLGIHIT